MKPYPLQLEISGPIALWGQPDTMPNPVSYVAPTFREVKGSFEGSAGASPASVGDSPGDSSIRWKSVNVRPTRCEICAPVQFHRYAFNYGGLLRKSGQIKDGTSRSLSRQMGEGVRRTGEGRRSHNDQNSISAVPDYPDSESGFRDGTPRARPRTTSSRPSWKWCSTNRRTG